MWNKNAIPFAHFIDREITPKRWVRNIFKKQTGVFSRGNRDPVHVIQVTTNPAYPPILQGATTLTLQIAERKSYDQVTGLDSSNTGYKSRFSHTRLNSIGSLRFDTRSPLVQSYIQALPIRIEIPFSLSGYFFACPFQEKRSG